MKILLVTGSFPPMPCGVGDYTAKLAESLAHRKNTEVAVLTDRRGENSLNGCPYQFLPGADGWRIAETLRITRDVQKWRPDVIHFQYPGREYGILQFVLPMLFRIMGYPVFLTLHEYYYIDDCHSLLTAILHLPNMLAARGVVVTREEYRKLMPSIYAGILRRKAVRHIRIASSIPTILLDDAERGKVRGRYGDLGSSFVSYFGFVSPQKGLEDLFRIADPGKNYIILICTLQESDAYHKKILGIIGTPPWNGRVTVTGFLSEIEVGRILSASDAVVLPFRNGVTVGNSSLHGAVAQGTFTLTTSREQHGYDPANNIYFARPEDIGDMAEALETYIGKRIPREKDYMERLWDGISDTHIQFYTSTI
jgi:glycosyltransferase involved in cell wall biosynthesis